jgi:DNA replication protein DnaC
VIFLGPPGTGKTHLSVGLGIRACQAGNGALVATASAGRLSSPAPTPPDAWRWS